MERNNYRFGARKMSKQCREINKMLDFVEVNNVGVGDLMDYISQQISTGIG
jgi:hypothetical protein